LRALDRELSGTLRQEIQAMNTDNFVVRPHREQVEKYRKESAWEKLNAGDFAEIAHILAGLPSEREPEDETAKRFDLMLLKLQLAVLNAEKSFVRLREQVKEIASRLEEKSNIPMVREQMELILDLQQDEYWADITLPMLEDTRRRLRDLVKFIDKKQRTVIYSDFTDERGEVREVSPQWLVSATGLAQYRKKVTHFLAAHQNHLAIHKLKRNLPITAGDITELERIFFESGELGTRADFEQAYGKQEHLGLFIRKLVGLDREAAKEAFGTYLSRKMLTANQIRFIDQMIDYLTHNGVMDPSLLYESPFTDYSPKGLDGVFSDSDAEGIVSILHSIREQAAA
ncbi:MAG: type I restriction-modification enzyme R subunit C-terminal domain-containing protein, partial [Candidatus Binatia bacterium]